MRGKTVAVLGAGHSAVGTILDLAKLKEIEPATQIVWVLRGDRPEKSFGGGANDKLVARGELGKLFAQLVASGQVRVETGFRLTHITAAEAKLRLGAGSACCGRHIEADELIVATGFRPDMSFLRELRLALDPALECPPILAPLIDPNLHSCGTVRPHGARELAQPETGFYFAGMKSYGRAPTFLMMTGYEQVRSIVADIAGDKEAAERVELVLPETGVCSRPVTRRKRQCRLLRRSRASQRRRMLPTRRRRQSVRCQGLWLLVIPIEFYFDFASPYGFLAAMQLDRIQRSTIWRPFLLGAVYKQVGQSPLEHSLKRDYVIRVDAPRMARRIGLTLKVPQGFPEHSLSPSRAFYWIDSQDSAKATAFAKAAYRLYWLEGHSTTDERAAADAAVSIGLDRDAVVAPSKKAASSSGCSVRTTAPSPKACSARRSFLSMASRSGELNGLMLSIHTWLNRACIIQ